jgi:hypothetical protein
MGLVVHGYILAAWLGGSRSAVDDLLFKIMFTGSTAGRQSTPTVLLVHGSQSGLFH